MSVRRALSLGALVVALGGCASEPYWSREDQAAAEKRDLAERLARAEATIAVRDAEIARLATRLREIEAQAPPPANAAGTAIQLSPPLAAEAIPVATAPLDPRRPAPSPIDESDLEAPADVAIASPGDSLGGAQASYDAALALLERQSHVAAEAAFRDFLARFPGSDLADNAQFWLAETLLRRGETGRAIAEFRLVVERYPEGNKVPDALLKVARGVEAQGDSAGALEIYRELVARYPGSTAAEAARSRLASP